MCGSEMNCLSAVDVHLTGNVQHLQDLGLSRGTSLMPLLLSVQECAPSLVDSFSEYCQLSDEEMADSEAGVRECPGTVPISMPVTVPGCGAWQQVTSGGSEGVGVSARLQVSSRSMSFHGAANQLSSHYL